MKIKTNLPKRAIVIGLGPIGLETCKLISATPGLVLAGLVDKDILKVGTEIFGVKVHSDLAVMLRRVKPALAFLTTSSRFPQVLDDIKTLIAGRVGVVSSCEELSFPWLRYPEESGALDKFIKGHQGRVLGTGVNPGFVMDFLPVAMATVCQHVESIHVRRNVDVSKRRLPLQKKMAVGLTPEEFQGLVKAHAIGHVGLQESVALLANGMGWGTLDIREKIAPILARRPLKTPHFSVKPGQVIGIAQTATGTAKGKTKVTLDLSMSMYAKDAVDEVHIEGTPPIHVRVDPGVQGDLATAACLVRGALRLEKARTGLLSVLDVPVAG